MQETVQTNSQRCFGFWGRGMCGEGPSLMAIRLCCAERTMVAPMSMSYDAGMTATHIQPVGMLAVKLSGFQIALIVVLALSLAVTAFRMARMASKLGRNPYRWFFISFFLTALPATIVFWRDQMKRMSASQSLPGWSRRRQRRGQDGDAPHEGDPDAQQTAGLQRCARCGSVLDPDQAGDGGARCPQCDMPRPERYA